MKTTVLIGHKDQILGTMYAFITVCPFVIVSGLHFRRQAVALAPLLVFDQYKKSY
jgi:hypothetical protein